MGSIGKLESSPNEVHYLNIFYIVDSLQEQRTKSVRSFDQYQFIHQFIIEYVTKKKLYSDMYFTPHCANLPMTGSPAENAILHQEQSNTSASANNRIIEEPSKDYARRNRRVAGRGENVY